jgi:cytochrome c553
MTGRARRSLGPVTVAVIIAAGFAAAATAQTPAAPDSKHGKNVSYTCLGCHGVDGYRNAYPNYSVPKLEGQHPEYLIAALKGYRDGDRSHITMHSQASTLSDQDIADIAVYFAGKPLKAAGGAPQGTLPPAGALCAACHGQEGVAVAPMYPSLAGQHEDYLVRALDEYKHGGRKNPVMIGLVGNLKDEDIAAIARYYSGQTPALSTEPRPYSILTEHAETP